MATTVGQILVNEALPPKFRDYERILTKDGADELLAEVAKSDPSLYREISHKLLQLGSEATFTEGTTLKLSNFTTGFDKTEMLKHVADQEKAIAKSGMSEDDKQKALESVYGEVQQFIREGTYNTALGENNPLALQVKSKARGNQSQLSAILSTPSVYQDAKGKTIPVFINRSYAEGLDPHEYWAATYGARKGVISTKFATRDAGYLGKQFGAAVMPTVVTEEDCGTPNGLPIPISDRDSIGAVMAKPMAGFPAGTVMSKQVMTKLKKSKSDEVLLRSPATCNAKQGVCKRCAGVRESGDFPEIGYHLGLNASSALAERIAQSNLNAKHSGGQSDDGNAVYAGFDVVNNLAQIPKTFPHRATVAELDGKISKIEDAPQGGQNIQIGEEVHYVSPDLKVTAKVGDTVEAGDQLSSGIVNPADAVRLKGLGEGRRYFIERMTQAFRESDYGINRRNVEVLARTMINHVAIKEPEGLGDYLPEDVVGYNALAHSYRPRKSSTSGEPAKMVGQYLEQPILHYTIGSKITPRTAAKMKQHGVQQVISNTEPAGFQANMVGLVKVPQHEKDWMARLGSNYLQSRLLEDVHRGAESNVHGLHPLPGIAKGTEFGDQKGKDFTF